MLPLLGPMLSALELDYSSLACGDFLGVGDTENCEFLLLGIKFMVSTVSFTDYSFRGETILKFCAYYSYLVLNENKSLGSLGIDWLDPKWSLVLLFLIVL